MKTKLVKHAITWSTIFVLLLLLVSHNYNDLLVTTRHGINFWDILLDGDFLAFYELNRCESGNAVYNAVQGCAYNILVYITFAIWNLPLYLLERFAGLDVMNSIPCLVYAKLLPVTAMAVTVIILKKILETMEIPKKQHNLLLYLYATSSLLVSVIFITGQYDILSLIFQLLGFHAFLKGKDKQFVAWFGVAFCFKYFAVVAFLPLLVLRHKKIWQWIKNLILLVIPLLITKVPFLLYGLLAGTAASGGANGDKMAAGFMGSMLGSANLSICTNIFVLAYAGILVWCYLQKNDAKENAANGVWACLLSYTAFFGLMNAYPYWSVLVVPFVTLLIALAPHQLYLNLILETIGTAALVFTNMIRYYWVYFGYTLMPMALGRLLEGTRFRVDFANSRINSIILRLNQETYYQMPAVPAIVNSVFVAAMIAMAFVAYPKKASGRLPEWPEESEYLDVIIVRFIVNSVLCMLPILAVLL